MKKESFTFIFQDQHQVLFKACGAIHADIECHEPIPVIFDSNCIFHMNLPQQCKLEPMKVSLYYKLILTFSSSVFITIYTFLIKNIFLYSSKKKNPLHKNYQ